jgi:hypothetical protein
MPYPQYTFAQRSLSAPRSHPIHEKHSTVRPGWSDTIDPIVLETAELSNEGHSNQVSAPSFKLICNKYQTTLQGTSLPSTPPRSQPVDVPLACPPPKIVGPLPPHQLTYTYKCTLCWKENKPPCYTIGPESRIVCLDCWRWIHSVSVCWKCNEVVFRKDDAVSFGWC